MGGPRGILRQQLYDVAVHVPLPKGTQVRAQLSVGRNTGSTGTLAYLHADRTISSRRSPSIQALTLLLTSLPVTLLLNVSQWNRRSGSGWQMGPRPDPRRTEAARGKTRRLAPPARTGRHPSRQRSGLGD